MVIKLLITIKVRITRKSETKKNIRSIAVAIRGESETRKYCILKWKCFNEITYK